MIKTGVIELLHAGKSETKIFQATNIEILQYGVFCIYAGSVLFIPHTNIAAVSHDPKESISSLKGGDDK